MNMEKLRTIAFALIASLSFSLPVFAEGPNGRTTNDYVNTKKTVQDNNNGTYTITLENYLEGESTEIINPVDFVLLMDLSSSMTSNKVSDGETRLAKLQSAAKDFVDILCKEEYLPTNGEYHKLSLIGFSSTSGAVFYNKDNSVDVTSSEATKMKTWIGELTTNQGTRSDEGLLEAYNNLSALTEDGRPKVVIFFTDGCPSTIGGSCFTSDYAQAAVNIAYAMKQPLGSINYTVTIPTATDSWTGEQYFTGTQHTLTKGLGATIYSVAILSSETSGENLADENITNDIRRFLNYTSSNYDFNIKSGNSDFDSDYFFGANYGTYGGDEAPHDFYKLSNGLDLSTILSDIATETIEDAKISMGAETTVVLDVLTDGFRLQKDVELSDIKLFTCDAVTTNTTSTVQWVQEGGAEKWVAFAPWGFDESSMGNYIFINDGPVGVADGKDNIQVKGFDYGENFVGPKRNYKKEITGWHGKKLIIQFDIEVNPSNPGGLNMPTNEETSGIYEYKEGSDEYKVVEEYERPTVHLPYLRITKDGLKEGESAIFHIVKVNEDGTVDMTTPYEATVIISNDGEGGIPEAILKLVCTGYYRIEEMTDWAWAYDPTQDSATPNPEVQTVYVHTVPSPEEGGILPEFIDADFGSELNDPGKTVDHGEDYVTNYMSAGTKSTVTSAKDDGEEDD